MHNSRAKLRADEKPTNTNKGHGLILETPYKPGFVDDLDLETVKMAVDKELSDISNAFYQTTERTADTIKRVDKLELEIGDGIKGLIEEEASIRKEQDGILAEKIETVRAESADGFAEVKEITSALSDGLGKVEAKWGVQLDVNGKISGIEMNNDGDSSAFEVRADRFTIADQTGNDSHPPFEVVGNETRIKSAYVERIQSDVYTTDQGWAINRNGTAVLNNAIVRGTMYATAGSFSNVTINQDCTVNGNISGATGTFTGSLNIADQGGNVGMKITNSQILIYDEAGRLRVKLGRL